MECHSERKEHNNPTSIFCPTCDSLICPECLASHIKKGCKGPKSLLSYATEELLPKYKAEIGNFEKQKGSFKESMEVFVSSAKSMKKELGRIKESAEDLLDRIQTLENSVGAALRTITILWKLTSKKTTGACKKR
eukprot:TRINITY_DN2622_c0_g3_i2.p1 TRINITY_DN2622_c0_g3~~TRINITY_DN2622_c0_g3_i2.p1  ORF type:complete len:135 (+),score=35.93 TRINITY_DN2622_c0_g3_i2:171-575(+)